MSITLTALQKQRRDTAANWTTANPTLLAGEIGIESDTGYWKVGDGSTAWTSLAYLSGLGAEIPVSRLADGTARQLLQTAANGTDVEWASNIDVPGTLDVTGVATFDNNVIVQGDLTVNGTTTTIDTTNLAIEDKNIEIGKVATPTDVTADGGGITLKGTTDKTINWVDATDAWTFSEHVNIASGKEYRIAGTKVLDATSLGSGVVSSSLTSVGTIGTGTWQGTAINKTYLDSTLVSTGDTGTVTSTMIANGTIVNDDINASAAIAGTKVSPDFGSQTITTTGVLSSALGTASAPSITFTGDVNTGLYSPGADQVAISTNGTGRLFVNSSGSVGIGTSSPGELLTLNSSGTTGTAVRLENTSAGGYNWGIYSVGSAASLGPVGSLAFRDSTNGATRLVIDSSGRLGIGTALPGTILDVVGSGNPTLTVRGSDAAYTGIVNIQAAGGGASLINATGGINALKIETNSLERARIDSSGRLLVGTSSGDTGGVIVRNYAYQATSYMRPLGYYGVDLGMVDNTNTRVWAAITSQYNQGSAVSAGLFLSASHVDTGGSACGYTIKHNKSDHSLAFSYVTTGASVGSSAVETERMRIASNGGFTSTAVADGEHSISNTNSTTFAGTLLTLSTYRNTTNSTYNFLACIRQGFAVALYIRDSGNVVNSNNSYGAISDLKLKENIVDANSQWNDIKALQVRKYNLKEGQTHTQIGLVAQEVELVSPGLVTESPDRDEEGNDLGTVTKSVNYSVLYMKAVKALQEAMERIEQLEAEMAEVKAQLS